MEVTWMFPANLFTCLIPLNLSDGGQALLVHGSRSWSAVTVIMCVLRLEGVPGIHKCDIHLNYTWDQQQHDYWTSLHLSHKYQASLCFAVITIYLATTATAI